MAQGVAWNKEIATEVLKPFFQLGCSVTKACKYAGIAQQTVDTWIQEDEGLRLKITGWQNEIAAKARQNWRQKVAAGEFDASKQWLERVEKDEFSLRTENTAADGKDLYPTPIMAGVYVPSNDSNDEGNGNEEENKGDTGGDVSEQDDFGTAVHDPSSAVGQAKDVD